MAARRSHRLGRRDASPDGRIHNVGMYRLQREANGELTRHATTLTQQYKVLWPEVMKQLETSNMIRPGGPQWQRSSRNIGELQPKQNRVQVFWTDGFPDRSALSFALERSLATATTIPVAAYRQNHRVLFVEGPTVVDEDFIPRAKFAPTSTIRTCRSCKLSSLRHVFTTARGSIANVCASSTRPTKAS